MKIGIISDTHLRTVSDSLRMIIEKYFQSADLILHAGDIVGGSVLTYLESAGVVAVRGNMDGWAVMDRLPTKRVIEVGPFTLGLIHGWGAPYGLAEKLRAEFDRIDCLIFGHSHEPMIKEVGPELYFNPGSAAETRGALPTIGLIHVEERLRGEIITVS